MMITCPACSARYQLPPGAIGPQGRTVRCTACGNQWLALPEDDLAVPVAPLAAPPAPPPSAAVEEQRPRAEDMPAPFDMLMGATPPVSSGPSGRRKLDPVQAKPVRRRMPGLRALAWAAPVVLILALPALAVLFRGAIVDAWPASSAAFDAVGLVPQKPGEGLEFVQPNAARPQDNPRAIEASTTVVNNVDRAVAVPPVLVTAIGAAGQVVDKQTIRIDKDSLQPGGTAALKTIFPDPQGSIATVNFEFVAEEDGQQ